MRRRLLALALAVGISGCFEVGQGVMPEASPQPEISPALPEATPTPRPLPRPLLPFVKRLAGVDRLFLYEALAPDVIEIPEAITGGPILNPFYFEVKGEGRVLYNSGAVIECPEGSGIWVPDIEEFGAYVLDLPRRLRYRLSEDDYFFSAGTVDGRLFAHLDVTVFPPPQRIVLVLEGEDEPFDEEVILAALALEPGTLVDLSIASLGGWIAAVKGPELDDSCGFPPPVAGSLYLYDLVNYRLFKLSELYDLPPIASATLSPTGRQIILHAGDQLLRLDRVSGLLDAMPFLNAQRGDGAFAKVRFLAGVEEVFYLEHRPAGGRSRILAYDWQAQRLNPLPMVNLVEAAADLYLAPP
jgi:hypothetical protein